MTDRYTAQMLRGGVSRSGLLRAGVLVCAISECGKYAWPCQFIDDPRGWTDVYARYPMNQVIRLPDVDVPFREIKAQRRFEKERSSK